ncbi:bacteriophage lysis protein [Escherichia coli M605]|uniref:Bacteriophage lysis protein n=1 Tax=Escherichia coli M605 TaxID=656417 RepID=F4T746_ECOLX|nr:lysis protein [Escherichia coli]EGI13123.1 bacteriophage lysis protein [Escherichia coli M605]
MNRITTYVIILLLVVTAALAWTTDHYYRNAVTYKEQRDKNAGELKLANATITDMQQRQRDVAALDARYSRELADAKAENDALRADVAAGRRRLRVRAVCPTVSADKTATATGVADAASPGLTDAAQRDYFILRERIATSDKMIRGLQAYIRKECQ